MECPTCKIPFEPQDINLAKDIALCRNCNKVFSVSQDLADLENMSLHSESQLEQDLQSFDITKPPDHKTWVRQTSRGISIGASLRSPLAYFFLLFLFIFGGISGVIFGSLLFGGELELTILLLFIPFFLVDLLILAFFTINFFGKSEVTIDRYDGEVFVGVFGFGWRKQFQVKEVKRVIEAYSNTEVNNVRKKHIVIETEQQNYAFGSLLKDARRRFIYLALSKYFYQLNQKLGK